MVMAMNVVKEGGLSVSAAASRFSVPTLNNANMPNTQLLFAVC